MKVTIVRGGGVAGLTSKTRLDSAKLPATDAQTLEERLRRCGLLGVPEPAAPRRGQPDEMLYAVTVADGEQITHRFGEEDLPDEVRSLVEWVDARPESERELGKGGG
jgi:hypothetical protein